MDTFGEKKGFLKENFKMFYIKNKESSSFDYHFHDFHKIVILINGNVNYLVEGKAYKLEPWDILFISNNEIHKPQVDNTVYYERFILWISPEYLDSMGSNSCDFSTCFKSSSSSNLNVLRMPSTDASEIQMLLYDIHREENSDYFGREQLIEALFIKLLITLTRYYINNSSQTSSIEVQQDDDISKILKYINDNLTSNINIDSISKDFFMNRYYLMHKFKDSTGFTLNNYIIQKRLILASGLLRKGIKPSEVYASCGFNDYSNFYRSFKKFFGISPKDYKNCSYFREYDL